jgi:hypothetical protein
MPPVSVGTFDGTSPHENAHLSTGPPSASAACSARPVWRARTTGGRNGLTPLTRAWARRRPPGKSRRAAPMACIGYFDRRHHAELREDSWRTRTEPPFWTAGDSSGDHRLRRAERPICALPRPDLHVMPVIFPVISAALDGLGRP